MNEQDFLASYNRRDFLSPLITVDAVLFTYHEEQLKVLLVKRGSILKKENGVYPVDLSMKCKINVLKIRC